MVDAERAQVLILSARLPLLGWIRVGDWLRPSSGGDGLCVCRVSKGMRCDQGDIARESVPCDGWSTLSCGSMEIKVSKEGSGNWSFPKDSPWIGDTFESSVLSLLVMIWSVVPDCAR